MVAIFAVGVVVIVAVVLFVDATEAVAVVNIINVIHAGVRVVGAVAAFLFGLVLKNPNNNYFNNKTQRAGIYERFENTWRFFSFFFFGLDD